MVFVFTPYITTQVIQGTVINYFKFTGQDRFLSPHPWEETKISLATFQVELVKCSPSTSVTCKPPEASNAAPGKTDLFVFVSLRQHHNLQCPGHIRWFATCLGKITVVSIISTNGERKVLARHPHESLYWLQQCFNSRQDHSGVTALAIRNFACLNLHSSHTLFFYLASSDTHRKAAEFSHIKVPVV